DRETAFHGLAHGELDSPATDGIAPGSASSLLDPAGLGTVGGDHHLGLADEGSKLSQSRREWATAQRDNRVVLVGGEAMAPIVADGASVAYAKHEEDPQHLDGKLVVAWVENQPVVRWFEHCGRFALLRAQNPSTVPQQVLIDLEDPKQRPRFRRVLWVNTPH